MALFRTFLFENNFGSDFTVDFNLVMEIKPPLITLLQDIDGRSE